MATLSVIHPTTERNLGRELLEQSRRDREEITYLVESLLGRCVTRQERRELIAGLRLLFRVTSVWRDGR
ncbi:MAG TPA: hypothetical protein VN033_04870 [Vulgatibacter sp.]|nr:hypothetical protein [Vulgatibacter sp.]